MTRPLIAIPGRRSPEAQGQRTAVVAGGRLYADAVQRAGGLPVVIPPTDDESLIAETIARCDGMVLLGGGDVSPSQYNEPERSRLYGVDEFLDQFEIMAVRQALTREIPVLAICRGNQILNVALGGSLIQHLETTEDHRDKMHRVSVVADSRVAVAMGTTEPLVHSFHHQAIDRLANGLTVVATFHDGTIEAVEHVTATWVVGVQWHPEDTAESDIQQQGLFDSLVQQSSR
jgi:putative glutamine amidotransferase